MIIIAKSHLNDKIKDAAGILIRRNYCDTDTYYIFNFVYLGFTKTL